MFEGIANLAGPSVFRQLFEFAGRRGENVESGHPAGTLEPMGQLGQLVEVRSLAGFIHLVQITIDIGAAILTGAVLSFLGLGVQPPTPDWGKMVDVGRAYMLVAPWYATFPGLCLFLVALSMNLLGDGLRDVLDPRTRRSG